MYITMIHIQYKNIQLFLLIQINIHMTLHTRYPVIIPLQK